MAAPGQSGGFQLRDCVASYASREAQRNKDGTWADLLIRATEGDCRAPFDEMARTLATRFGEGRIEPVMRELIDTTFLPAAKQAAAEGAPASAPPSSDIPPLPPIPKTSRPSEGRSFLVTTGLAGLRAAPKSRKFGAPRRDINGRFDGHLDRTPHDTRAEASVRITDRHFALRRRGGAGSLPRAGPIS